MDHISLVELAAYIIVLVAAAALIHRFRHPFLRGIPDLSAQAVGVLRIAFGLVLFEALNRLGLPDAEGGRGNVDEAMLWEPWGWVEYLVGHWDLRDALYVATYVAVGAFTLGALTRLAYAAVCAGFVVRLLVAQEFGAGSHAWVVLPLALLPLLVVPWGDALSLDAWIRSRRGKPSRVQPPGPRYGLAVWLPGLTLGCAWLAAAGAKLTAGGPEWVTGGAVRYHWAEDVLNAKVDWGSWIAGHEWAAVLVSAGGITAEALFITHALFRSEWVRLAYGLLGLSLLGGFYLFQGLLWYPWWALLLFFLPWQHITDLLGRVVPRLRTAATPAAERTSPARRLRSIGPAAAGLAAFLLVQQAVMSREAVEQMPFFSNYPMYSNTHESPEAFNGRVAPIKYYRYRYRIAGGGGDTPGADLDSMLTDQELEALRNAVVWRLRYGDRPLAPDEVESLVRVREDSRERLGTDLAAVRVDTEPRIFDFDDGGGITAEGAPRVPPVEVDLVRLETRAL